MLPFLRSVSLHSTRWLTGVTIAVLLLTLVVYWPGLKGAFVLDDQPNIVKSYIPDPDAAAVLYSITHNPSGLLGRSVSIASFVLTGLQYGLDPWGYKFHNLLIHLACGVLLFRLLFRLLQQVDLPRESRLPLVVAGIVTALWLLHPLQVSTVLYVVQRMTQLAVLFTLLALLAYLEARMAAGRSRRYWVFGWLIFPLCLVLAMLSKEIGTLIPFYVLIIEFFVFRDSLVRVRQNPQLSAWLLVFVALPLTLGGIYVLTHFAAFTDHSMRTFTLGERLLTQVHVVFFYVRQILLPRVGDMSLFHDDFPITRGLDPATLLLIAALCGVVVLIWLARKRFPVLSLGLAWFLVSHLLESTVFPLEMVFEHRNYLAAAGLLLPPVWYVFKSAEAEALRWALIAYGAVFSLQTFSRVQEWSSEAMMMTVAVLDHPRSQRAHTLYANYLFTRNEIDEALAQLRLAQDLKPQDAGPGLHLLMFNCAAKIRDDAVIARVDDQLRAFPLTPYALNGLESLLGFYNRRICDVMNFEDFERLYAAALAMPDNSPGTMNYGYIRRFQAMLAFMQGKYAQGVIAYREAFENSKHVSVLAELVKYQISFGYLADAEDTLAYVVEVNEANLGIDRYVVQTLRTALAQARQPKAAPAAPEPAPALPLESTLLLPR
ncbi:MAG: hypothetical protein RLZZ227_1702 [Pseudomonadota bacterium]|jgi:tetratricopeptide (TPR) repeat protein